MRLFGHIGLVHGSTVLVNVEIRDLLRGLAHDDLVDVTDGAPIDLLSVGDVACVAGEIVLIEGCAVGG